MRLYAHRFNHFILTATFTLLALPFAVMSQHHFTAEHLSTENGLSNGSVSVMHKDKRGFMWFGTWNGLNRYDGISFKVFKPSDINEKTASSNQIKKIREDMYGNIWVVTSDSIAYRLNRLTEAFEPLQSNSASAHNVLDIFTASTGYVWIATSSNGIYKVTTEPLSNRWQEIQHWGEDGNNLPGNAIGLVAEDALKNIWVTTNKGAACFNYLNNNYTANQFPAALRDRLNKHRITSILQGTKQLFFGTADGCLLRLEQTNNHLTETTIHQQTTITTLTANGKGMVYIGTKGKGVVEFDEHKGTIGRQFAPSGNILAIFPDSNGRLWIETTEAGITKIDLQSGLQKHFSQTLGVTPDLRNSAQCGFMEDGNQTVWLTLKGGGFGFYNPVTDNVDYFSNNPSDPASQFSNFVGCFYCDPSGVLWLSTYFKGIEKIAFAEQRFRFVQPAAMSSFSNANEIRAVMEDSRGTLWVATKSQELYLMDNEFTTKQKIGAFNGQSLGMVYAMMEDTDGKIYLGTKGNGLFILSPKGNGDYIVQHFLHQQNDTTSLSNNNIYSLLQDKMGRIWIGTYGGGVNLLRNGRFVHSGNELKGYPQSVGQKVRHIAEDANGHIWIASNDGLMFLAQKSLHPSDLTFRHYSNAKGTMTGVKGNDIYWTLCNADGNIWITSLGGGLSKLDAYPTNAKDDILAFTSLTPTDGLPSDVVYALAADNKGNLWLSTENGIASYDTANHLFRRFGRPDGIADPVFSEGAVVVRKDGTFCFGAHRGLYAFRPSDLLNDQRKVDLLFTAFHLFGKEALPSDSTIITKTISETETIKLHHHQNVFSIAWTGLDFSMTDKIQYAYQLEGYDRDWQFAGNNHQAGYSKIPPGKYLFKVKYVNPELQALNHPKSLVIEILPPWWKTGWAIAAYLLLGVLIFEIARRNAAKITRLQNKVVVEKELSEAKLRFFTNVSHELRTPLTLIIGPAEELEMNEKLSDQGVAYAKLIRQNAQRLLRTISQLLDLRKIENDKMTLNVSSIDMVAFCSQLCLNFDTLARDKHIAFAFNSHVDKLEMTVDADKMESVIYNLLSNAFKFTKPNGSINVDLNVDNKAGTVTIEVADSGIGIAKEQEPSLFKLFSSQQKAGQSNQPGTGIGLALSKELVQLHGGELTYRPTPGGGTTFCVCLKTNGRMMDVADTQQQSFTLPEKEQNLHLPDQPSSSADLPCVLVVEDNQELRHFISLQLGGHYRVIEAANGKEALEKASSFQPDLIVSDVIMPIMDGINMLDAIKSDFNTSHIPVILLTSKSSVESRIEGLQHGADAYLTKPFHSAQLLAQIDNLLKQRKLLQQHMIQGHKDEVAAPMGITAKDAEFLNRVKAIVDKNITDPDFKIGDIYTQLGMGRTKFYDKLKGLTGIAPIDYIKENRLYKAQQLLSSGLHNVTEASYLSGFSDAGYFSKCYKERFGVLPSSVTKT